MRPSSVSEGFPSEKHISLLRQQRLAKESTQGFVNTRCHKIAFSAPAARLTDLGGALFLTNLCIFFGAGERGFDDFDVLELESAANSCSFDDKKILCP